MRPIYTLYIIIVFATAMSTPEVYAELKQIQSIDELKHGAVEGISFLTLLSQLTGNKKA